MKACLSHIVTRAGDSGMTGLFDGSRVQKNILRMEAIGSIDELNCFVGEAICRLSAVSGAEQMRTILFQVQQDLFDLGGAMSRPGAELLSETCVRRLDDATAVLNSTLPPLQEFILPGGAPAVCALHVARSVCRRVERTLISALEIDPQPSSHAMAFLNRLSDFLFVASRASENLEGVMKISWDSDRVENIKQK